MRPPVNVIKKICILGNPAVGKSSLIRRFVYNQFSDDYIPTIGTKVCKKSLLMDFDPKRSQQINMSLLIFDLLGQTEYAKIHKAYYSGSEAGIIVGDLTREDTILALLDWKHRFQQVVGDVPLIFLGNKQDICDEKVSTKDLLSSIAADDGHTYLFTSAKNGENVETAFQIIATEILRRSPI